MSQLKNRSNHLLQKNATCIVLVCILACLILSCSPDSSSSVSEEETHSLSVEIKGQGEVKESQLSSKLTEYAEGSMVELMAVPAEQWEFIRWEGGVEGADNPKSISISNNISVTAIFQHEDVKVEIEGEGDVDVEILDENGKMKHADRRVRLTATPEDGWQFVSWEGDVNGTENPVEVSFEDEVNADAVFVSGSGKWVIENSVTEHVTSSFFLNKNEGWITTINPDAGENEYSIYHTDNGGYGWNHQFTNKEWQFTDIMFVDKNIGWAVGGGNADTDHFNSGVIFYTDNGGQTWREQYTVDRSCACYITALNQNKIFVSGYDDEDLKETENDGLLLRSINGGQNWEEIELFGENHPDGWVTLGEVEESGPSTLWVPGAPQTFRSENAGINWKQASESYYLVDFVNSSTGWGFNRNGMYKTNDGGKNWSLQTDLSQFGGSFDMQFINSSLGWIGANQGIFMTTNGGASWSRQNVINGDDSVITAQIQIIDSQTVYAVGVYGEFLRYLPR
ncbi:InlB B-repeat-containing protein [Rhodohalobacter sulfatireducens]|uniref:Bacterial repeat domain-containing protein n=1 Tax=Rhodohalobacter sulfatireducens TaxID=2911366 RepID=A0ABS9KAV4_9BACT|nr:hypothetical protein [Rhodohalobacter sulfatireducens]MCG2587983.1 hypothetical protein [Rhodohalobacter sulfatireducens]